jgi:lipid-binding SYLF domain-containing protein
LWALRPEEKIMPNAFLRPLFLALIALLLLTPQLANAASKAVIDARIIEALDHFKTTVTGGEDLLERASGVLIFPHVTKAGLGLGGEKGDGALQIDGETVGYYQTVAVSIGLQLGVQVRTQFILFMNDQRLNDFRAADGWEVGVDGSVTLINLDAGGAIDSTTMNEPAIGFILNAEGLMYNLTLEGSKISRISR